MSSEEKEEHQLDLFTLDIIDAAPKDDRMSMEFPIFSLSKKKDMKEYVYENRGHRFTIVPSGRGRATMYDKNILLYCGSQLVEAFNRGENPGKWVQMSVYDFLKATGQSTGGNAYDIEDRLVRLEGTTVIWQHGTPDGWVESKPVKLIEDWHSVTKEKGQQLVGKVNIKLSDWFYHACKEYDVLTLDRQYFSLTRPLEMRMYELARKYVGRKDFWQTRWSNWLAKLGGGMLNSNGKPTPQARKYKSELKKKRGWKVLGYWFTYNPDTDMIIILGKMFERYDISGKQKVTDEITQGERSLKAMLKSLGKDDYELPSHLR